MNQAMEDRLRAELRAEANEVNLPAGFVARAVADVRSRRQRRQSRVVGGVAAVVAVVGVGGVAWNTQSDDSARPPDVNPPTPSESNWLAPALDPSHVRRIRPGEAASAALPWRDTALPRAVPTDVSSAPALSSDPIDHALALVAGPGATVGVIGDDGELRRLDGVHLEQADDPLGYRANPVTQRGLTPDGRLAAFPQPGGVVVVDLASGASRRFAVPGHNALVVWHPDEQQILVGREDGGSSVLDLTDGSVRGVPYDAGDSAFAEDGSILEFNTSLSAQAPDTLTRWDGNVVRYTLPLSTWRSGSENPPHGMSGQLVFSGSARLTYGSGRSTEPASGWIVVDSDTGEPRWMLRPPDSWYGTWAFGLCGWLDRDTVLVQGQYGLLAWTPAAGKLERVSAAVPFRISLAADVLE